LIAPRVFLKVELPIKITQKLVLKERKEVKAWQKKKILASA